MTNYKIPSIIAIAVTVSAILFIVFLSASNQTKNEYYIKAYRNTVALYENGNIIKTYDDIVLNTLPYDDILMFENGITAKSKEDAENLLEDFDG